MYQEKYDIIGRFDYENNHMVVVRIGYGIYVMPIDEWMWTFGKLHPEKRQRNNN